MSGLHIQNIVSLTPEEKEDNVEVKEEPVDPEYDAAQESDSRDSNASESSVKSDMLYPSADSSQRIRGILNTMINDNSKELSVKGVIEDLLQRNEYLLAQNDAGLYKPQPRNMSLKRYEEMMKNKEQPAANGNSVKSDVPGEGAILRPSSPTQKCSIPKKDMTSQTFMEMQVKDTEAEDAFKVMKHEIVCGVASKAFVMTKEGVNIQTDLQFYWCNFCPYKTETKDVLLQHVMEHRFHCKYCEYQSFSRADVIRHANKEHAEFEEIAKTLKYCTYKPDFVQVESQAKKRRNQDDDTVDSTTSKRAKTETTEEPTKKSKRKDSKPKRINGSKSAQEEDYDAFDMEVDEVDDDMYDREVDEQAETSERVIVPSSTPKSKMPTIALKPGSKSPASSPMVSSSPAPTPPASIPTPIAPKPSSTVTVSSGLCWNCGYCDFVTLSQTFLKTHLNTQHTGKAHKYVAMLVSSQEEMNKIKERDAQMYQNPNPALLYGNVARPGPFANVPTVTAQKTTNQSPVSSAIETSASYDDSGDDEEFLPEAEKKKYPLTYKCAHCNFNAPVSFKIKEHLQLKHLGCVLYALDMRAVKLKQRRYVFFCHRKNCSFTSKKTEEYLSHSESCTPWLMESCPEPVDNNTKKCLELTRSFSQKISQKAFQMAKNFKTGKTAEYACIHCSYTSNNNTRVKKHILSNHKDSETTMKDLQAPKMNKKTNVYFCKFCLWETREGGELETHIKDRHSDAQESNISAASTSGDNSTPVMSPAVATPRVEPPLPSIKPIKIKFESQNEASMSSMDSASPSPAPSDEDNIKDEEDYMDDLEVPEEDVRNLMDLYIADEASRGGSSPGRPTREAAARASIRVRAQGHQPPLFRCIHCHALSFGVNLMRQHLRIHHPNEAYRAMDIKKKNSRQACYFCFCPKDGCHFSHCNEENVINHAVNEHKYRKEEEELKRLQVLFNAPQVMSSHSSPSGGGGKYNAAFECLYCSESYTKGNMEKMRQHIHTNHPGEEVIFRDCVARKLRKTSRVFMCGHPPCMFSTADQKEYTLHKLAHDQSQIYECARCQWFTANADQVGTHMSAVHAGEQVTTMEIFLDLDSKGSVVKKVGGTVIKQEPE